MKLKVIGIFMITLICSNAKGNTCDFGYVQSTNSSQESCIPELFYYNSSTQQAAYFFESVIIDGISLTENDWIGAFNGNICVGARKWDINDCNGICDVPILGQDSSLTDGYMLTGEIPIFKIFRASDLSYIEASPSEDIAWSNFSTPVISLLYACDQSDCSPDCLGINGGLSQEDCSGVCNGDSVLDCEGECNGSSVEDCLGVCNGNAILDDCGVCNGDNSTCLDCLGIPNGNSIIDCEGVCNGGATNCDQLSVEIVDNFILINAYPNPFNPSTIIEFSLPENENVSLSIYDINGKEINKILDKYLLKNKYEIEWNGRDNNGNYVPSGIYMINLVINNSFYRRKVTLIK